MEDDDYTYELTAEDRKRVLRKATIDKYTSEVKDSGSWKSKAWRILNSAFALWFLSAIVVTGITSCIAERERTEKERSESTLHYYKLLYELGQRWKTLHKILDGNPNDKVITEFLFSTPEKSDIAPGFPEFNKYSLSALLMELQIYSSDKRTISDIRDIRLSHVNLLMNFDSGSDASASDGNLQKDSKHFEKSLYGFLTHMGYEGDIEKFDPSEGDIIRPMDFPPSKYLPNISVERDDSPRSGSHS